MELTTEIYKRIVAAKVFIDKNYREPINLDQIANQAFLSRFHFHRLFKHIYKITPHQYLTRIRLEAAKMSLAEEGVRIQDICNSIGFESHGSFSTLFNRQSGQSPKYFRNMALLKRKQAKEEPKRFIPHCFVEQFNVGKSES